MSEAQRIAVIGAGLSGLVCARELEKAGPEVVVFDKGRRPGGRLSTRITRDGLAFDHGAQYFTARTAEFQRETAEWVRRGWAARWEGKIVSLGDPSAGEPPASERYVGVPEMNTPCLEIARELDVSCGVRILRIERNAEDGWRLFDREGSLAGDFDHVVLALPPSQARDLAPLASPLQAELARVAMRPCWAVMAAYGEPLQVDFDGAFVERSPLAWIARSSAKPGRAPTPDRWTLHASADWSEAHLSDGSQEVASALASELDRLLGASAAPQTLLAHRWRFAIPVDALDQTCLYDAKAGVGACGDWCGGPRVEGAYRSGLALARAITAEG